MMTVLALIYVAGISALFVAGGTNKRTRLIGLGGVLCAVYLAVQVLA